MLVVGAVDEDGIQLDCFGGAHILKVRLGALVGEYHEVAPFDDGEHDNLSLSVLEVIWRPRRDAAQHRGACEALEQSVLRLVGVRVRRL